MAEVFFYYQDGCHHPKKAAANAKRFQNGRSKLPSPGGILALRAGYPPNEMRGGISSVSPFEQGFFNVQPRYHISNERIKKYYPVDLQKLCQIADTQMESVITELIVGPESTQSVPILQDYLRDMGYEKLAEKVTHSACPLRQKL
ncbi:MAG: hypothetical protein LUG99_03895 [Lachnospiraceae bacterium]|nr:hypothetical protein [Lachnospiraceae bacterium]